MQDRTRVSLAASMTLLLVSQLSFAGDFEDGVEAFRSGRYEDAIRAFESALRAGREDDRLWYNLGSSYYRAGRYARAREAFSRIDEDSSLWQAARYNLGLVALKLGERKEAERRFREAMAGDVNSGIARLAQEQLAELRAETGEKSWQAYVEGTLGYDDNVNFAPLGVGSQQSDQFLDLYGSARWYLSGSRNRGWALNARLGYTDYFDGNRYDFNNLVLGGQYHLRSGKWRARLAGDIGKSNYGGNSYQTVLTLTGEADYLLPRRQRLRFRVRLDDITSDNALYDYLEGSRQRLGVTWYGGGGSDYWDLGYRLELNDRRDQARLSYSPTRHEFKGKYTRYLKGGWQLEGRLSWRISDYPLAPAGKRDDDRLKLRLGTAVRLQKRTKLRLSWEYTNNDSTLATYDYTRNQIRVSLSHSF